jgi:hypothetical protein
MFLPQAIKVEQVRPVVHLTIRVPARDLCEVIVDVGEIIESGIKHKILLKNIN